MRCDHIEVCIECLEDSCSQCSETCGQCGLFVCGNESCMTAHRVKCDLAEEPDEMDDVLRSAESVIIT